MRKLLFVISQLYKGGAETAMVNLINKMDKEKYQIDFLVLNQQDIKNSISLIGLIDERVNVCDARLEEKKRKKLKGLYTTQLLNLYGFAAVEFVRNKRYDCAFFIGEWSSPRFVAEEVVADKKIAWIHTDIAKSVNFNDAEYFQYYEEFDYFIFVSKHSLESSIKKYPFLRDKAVVIYNVVDQEYLRAKAKEANHYQWRKPIRFVTCANIRPEKNHIRQLEVLKKLCKKGYDIEWVNLGHKADKEIVTKLAYMVEEYELRDNFILYGAEENPYKFMKDADAVLVLSDYESWSMVITEGKTLGVPVIATSTSGACEQIVDGENGVLTDFTVDGIVNKIETFLINKGLQETIKNNLVTEDNLEDILTSLDELIERKREKQKQKEILFVIDDVNYVGGAHGATIAQIKALQARGHAVAVFSNSRPDIRIRKTLPDVTFLSLASFFEDRVYTRRLSDVLRDRNIDKEVKLRKLKYSIKGRLLKAPEIYSRYVIPQIIDSFNSYHAVCSISESSVYRSYIAKSGCRKKIQWIHTDYCSWKDLNDWTRWMSKDDKEIYQKFDTIVLLSERIKQKFVAMYPDLKDKVVVNQNIMPSEQIIKAAKENVARNSHRVKFVSVSRIDMFKGYERLFNILRELKIKGYIFEWTIVGDGPNLDSLVSWVVKNGMTDYVKFTGRLENPFSIMTKAEIFSLLSFYEGLPNTIYEALILGIPVLATDVGGISSQIIENENGWLVGNSEEDIRDGIVHILEHPEEIKKYSENLKQYRYDNQRVIDKNLEIFGLKD